MNDPLLSQDNLSEEHPSSLQKHPWHIFYEPGVPHSISYRNEALFTWLDEAATQTPHKTACQFVNTKISYARLRKEAEIIAANLQAAGVRPGDRVGIMLPNLPQTICTFWAILKAGATVCMINPLYMEKELLHQFNDANIQHLITIDLCWPKLEELRSQLPVTHYYLTTIADGLSFPLNWVQRIKTYKESSKRKIPYDNTTIFPFSFLRKGRKRLSLPVANPKETPAVLQYTGGTTGIAKGAVLTHFNLGANIQQTSAVLHCLQGEDQVIVGVVPFFHVYGMTTCMILPTILRASVVPLPRFLPADLLTAIRKYKATVLPGAPAIYISLLQQKKAKKTPLPSLKFCISGSAPMPVECLKQFEAEFSATLIEGYGLSEASPITHLNPARGIHKAGSIGLPYPDTEARIVDMELGTIPMPPGKVGELIIRGPQIMKEYWNRPDETASTLRNGWLYTGDIAVMDEDGYFSIVDRKKDMIVVGGYNVAPREIDEVLYEHPQVKEAVAVGVPHPTRGEIIKVYVVPVPDATLDKTDIVNWCRQRLANYKLPRQVEFRTELPKTLVGKILRRKLREEEVDKNRCDFETQEDTQSI